MLLSFGLALNTEFTVRVPFILTKHWAFAERADSRRRAQHTHKAARNDFFTVIDFLGYDKNLMPQQNLCPIYFPGSYGSIVNN
jgi:hypothetical protein